MKTYYLKAANRQELIDALITVGMWSEDGYFLSQTQGDALDEIGTIHKETGRTIISDGLEIPETQPIPGYHANLLLRGELPQALEPLTIPQPARPVRVWA